MKRTIKISRLFLTCIALFFVLADTLVWACPNCKDGLASDPTQAGLIRGFYWSILFLLSMPFLITAGMGSYFYWQICKARKAAAQTEQPSSPFGGESSASKVLEPVEV